MRTWARRAAVLHGELAALAELDVRDPRWWLVAGGAALGWPRSTTYVASDGEPDADTVIGTIVAPPRDPIADALARAHAARVALRALDGALPDQPLAVTIRRTPAGAQLVASGLEIAAFAIGDRCWCAPLAARLADERALADDLAAVIAGRAPAVLRPLGGYATPFVAIALGDEPLATARHGHRRAWLANGVAVGPWLGLGRAGELAVASTCHFVVDGYGHARLAAAIAALTSATIDEAPTASLAALPPLAIPARAAQLAVAWRELPTGAARALPLSYALGVQLHRLAGRRAARFSPTLQIPIAPGAAGDPLRRRRRAIPALASVRFADGSPEPFADFEARARAVLARESSGTGLTGALLDAARGAPAPLAWKRRAVAAARPRWLEPIAALIGGRGCVSRIVVDDAPHAVSPACAISSPGQLATAADPLGGSVVTVIDDGRRAAITLCGSGLAAGDAAARLDELLAGVPSICHT